MSAVLKEELKAELKNIGFKETDMNDKLVEAIAKAVQKYLNKNVTVDLTKAKVIAP